MLLQTAWELNGMNTTATLLVIALAGLLLMYLIQSRGHYSRFTRILMDILAAITLSGGLLVLLRLLFID